MGYGVPVGLPVGTGEGVEKIGVIPPTIGVAVTSGVAKRPCISSVGGMVGLHIVEVWARKVSITCCGCKVDVGVADTSIVFVAVAKMEV